MFPTPPSIEHHPNSSPYGSGIPDTVMAEIIERHDVYPNLGSPAPDPIEVSHTSFDLTLNLLSNPGILGIYLPKRLES